MIRRRCVDYQSAVAGRAAARVFNYLKEEQRARDTCSQMLLRQFSILSLIDQSELSLLSSHFLLVWE